MLEHLRIFGGLWLGHTIMALIVASPLLHIGRHRVTWQPFELLAFVVPFATWTVLTLSRNDGKSLSNLGECFTVSIGIVIAIAIRIAVGDHLGRHIWPACLILSLVLGAVGTYVFTPSLPE